MADMSTTYDADGTVRTTTQAPTPLAAPQGDMGGLFYEMARRAVMPAAPRRPGYGANPVTPTAIPGMPGSGQIYHPQPQQQPRGGGADPGHHTFVSMAGAHQGGTMDWIPSSYQPRAVYGGWDPTAGGGKVDVAEAPNLSATMRARGAQDLQMDTARRLASAPPADDGQRADFYGLNKYR